MRPAQRGRGHSLPHTQGIRPEKTPHPEPEVPCRTQVNPQPRLANRFTPSPRPPWSVESSDSCGTGAWEGLWLKLLAAMLPPRGPTSGQRTGHGRTELDFLPLIGSGLQKHSIGKDNGVCLGPVRTVRTVFRTYPTCLKNRTGACVSHMPRPRGGTMRRHQAEAFSAHGRRHGCQERLRRLVVTPRQWGADSVGSDPSVLLTSCGTLGNPLPLAVPQFTQIQDGDEEKNQA